MEKIFLCVPNISEGKDKKIIWQIANVVDKYIGVKLLDVAPDADHNRTVITFAGGPTISMAAYDLIRQAAALIDMRRHKGEHPRFGAVDVCPFISVLNVTMEECVTKARVLGAMVGSNFKLPVYLYGKAAIRPERMKVSNIRKGEYEGLGEKMKDPKWKPDFGPAEFNPKFGAVAIGARYMMLAYNVNLKSRDLDLAKKIAKLIRGSGNGIFPSVQARGMDTREQGHVQVSMNLQDYKSDSLGEIFQAIKNFAAASDVDIHSSEIIGVVPRDALTGISLEELKLKDFKPEKQIIEEALGL